MSIPIEVESSEKGEAEIVDITKGTGFSISFRNCNPEKELQITN